jgi:hypothetical protein
MFIEIGYEPERVIAADMHQSFRHPNTRNLPTVNERLRSLPGVEAVGMIQSTPLTGKWKFREQLIVEVNRRTAQTAVPGSLIAFDYFKAMGIPVISGRPFTEQEFTSPDPPR